MKKFLNKKILIIGIIILTLILLFFGYKCFMLYRYSFEKPDNIEDIVKGLKNQKTLKIKKNKLNDNEYITIENYKIKNILDGYKENDNGSSYVRLYKKEENNKQYAIQFSLDFSDIQIVDAFLNDITVYADFNDGFLKGNINDADRKGFLEKNNIKNDIDFYKFVADNYFIESNIFTDTKTIKQNYAFNLITSIAVPEIDGWIILEGDIDGYIMNIGTKDEITAWQITIIDDNKRYNILTTDPRFKDESFLIDFVSSIEIIR